MKVKELISLLLTLPEDFEIIMSQDSEGNSFGPYGGYSTGMYVSESNYYGYLRDKDYTDEDDEPYKDNCVVIWPIN